MPRLLTLSKAVIDVDRIEAIVGDLHGRVGPTPGGWGDAAIEVTFHSGASMTFDAPDARRIRDAVFMIPAEASALAEACLGPASARAADAVESATA